MRYNERAKKFVSISLSLVLALGTMSTALAAPGDYIDRENSIEFTSRTELITALKTKTTSPEDVYKELEDGAYVNVIGEDDAIMTAIASFLLENYGEITSDAISAMTEDREKLSELSDKINDAKESVEKVEIVIGKELKVVDVSAINANTIALTFNQEHPEPGSDEWKEELTGVLTFFRSINGGEFEKLTDRSFTHTEEYPKGLNLVVILEEIEATNEEQSVVYRVILGDNEPVDAEAFVVEAPEAALTVENVSAIDTTKVVTVKATAPNVEEGATAAVAVFAYDEEGVRGETAVATAPEVEIVEGAIEVEFEGLITGEYVAVVTVGEEEAELDFALDFEAVDAAVKAVNDADTQIKLASALKNEYFVDVYVEANIVAYVPLMANDYSNATVAEVIEDIVAINEAEAAADAIVEVKKALNEAHPNQLIIINILDENFKAVNEDYIVEYMDSIYSEIEEVMVVGLDSMAAIQDAIYLVNAEHAVLGVETALAELEGDGNDTQAEIDNVQELHDAAFDLVDALESDPNKLAVDLETVQDGIDTAQNALDSMNDAIEAAETALAAHIATGGKEDDAAYVALVTKLELETKVIGDIIAATTDLKVATDDITKEEDLAALAAAVEILKEKEIFANIDAIKAVVPAGIKVSVALTKAPAVGEEGTAKVTLTKNAQTEVISEVKLAHLILEAPEKRETVADNLIGVTEAGAKFLVYGLPADGPQKSSTLAEVKAFIDDKYHVDFNADAIKVTDGKIEIVGSILSTEDWNKVKAKSTSKDEPYRITLVQDDSKVKVIKIAMYEDGVAILEEIK